MASWMVHLRIAEKLYNEIDRLSERDFIIGSIAPNCSDANVDGSILTPPKEVTHFLTSEGGRLFPNPELFYRQYIYGKDLKKEKYSFYLGYYCHLLVDLFWDNEISYPTKDKLKNELPQDRNNYIGRVKKDLNDLDYLFLSQNPDFRSYKILKENRLFMNEHLEFFMPLSFFNKINYFVDLYDKKPNDVERGYKYFTPDKLDNFIEQTTKKILVRITHEWSEIKSCTSWKIIEQVNRGWSGDKKYNVETFSGKKYLLRISDKANYEKKKVEYNFLKTIDSISINKPIEFGYCSNENLVYCIFNWLEGHPLEKLISDFNKSEQYKLGYQAGNMLKKIHSIYIPEMNNNWEKDINKKIDRNIKIYIDTEIKVENMDKVIDYINKNRDVLADREQSFLHGDFNLHNIIVDSKSKKISITGFDRYSFGDPWFDFECIVKSAMISTTFASGQIDGYFDNNVPDDFFKALALYIGNHLIYSIPWSIPYGDFQTTAMINQTQSVLEWYNNFNTYKPKWYKKQIII